MSDFKKRPIKDIVNEFKRLGDFATRNHYAVIGIQDFSTYDDSFKQVRENEINLEFPVNVHPDDNNIARKMLNQAAAALKDPKKKQEFDTKFRQYLDEEAAKPKADIRLGKPILLIEENGQILEKAGSKTEGYINFHEIKLDTTFTRQIVVKNASSGGILRGIVSIPPNITWLDVTPKTFDQSDLPLPLKVTVNTNSIDFKLEELRRAKILFSYATDTDRIDEYRWVEVTTEGLEKKTQRLSQISTWIFVAFYAVFVIILTINTGSTAFNMLYKLLIWASVPMLYYFLKGYNLYGFGKIKKIFSRESSQDKLELAILISLLFFSPELLLLFGFGVLVLWLNRQVTKRQTIKNGTLYTPFVGVLLYVLLLTQAPFLHSKYLGNGSAPPSTSSNVQNSDKGTYVQIIKDCTIRTTPSLKGTVVFVGKAGETYKVDSSQVINKEWARIKYIRNSIEQTGYVRLTKGNTEVIQK